MGKKKGGVRRRGRQNPRSGDDRTRETDNGRVIMGESVMMVEGVVRRECDDERVRDDERECDEERV